MIVSLVLLVIPFAIVGFWTKRPVIALILATVLAVLLLAIPSIIQFFQDIVAYSSDDPQLMADLISRVLISRVLVSLILVMFIIFPLLFIFQILMRRRRKKTTKPEASLKTCKENYKSS